jgi:predicted molibdopterin-dependent oxidoreductase YjgC
MPDRAYMNDALSRVKLRVHQDIVLNTSSLLPGPAVILLPAQTRYETPGGGTSTSTERRIRFSPEIAGPRIAEARPEWRIPIDVARAARPALAPRLAWKATAEIRAEMGHAIPFYAGIETLAREGQSVQWGGERLFADGFQRMPGGRARFSPVPLPEVEIPPGKLYLTTRRGKQFNSMAHEPGDYLMGATSRRDVLMNPADAAALGIADGAEILLRSEAGEWTGIARLAPMKERHLQAYWPEVNVLISRRFDPVSGVPDYNVVVSVEPAGPLGATTPVRVESAQPVVPAEEPAPAMARSRRPAGSA